MTTASRNWRRRSLGLVVAAAPVILAVLSLIAALRATVGPPANLAMVIAVGFLTIAIWIALVNSSKILVRYLLSRWIGIDGGSTSSVHPLVGTVAVVISLVFGFGSLPISALALGVLAFDTGGSPWILASTWPSREIWDGAPAGTDLPDET